jgi:dephospho-CoA kinase
MEVFRKSAEVLLVAIHASRSRRFNFLRGRGRSDDPASYETFQRRDERELEVGIGKAIALADEVLSNEHTSSGVLSGQMVNLVERWINVPA